MFGEGGEHKQIVRLCAGREESINKFLMRGEGGEHNKQIVSGEGREHNKQIVPGEGGEHKQIFSVWGGRGAS